MSRLAPFRRLAPFAALLGLLLGAPAQAALPLPDDDRPLLRIHGSNTIGARLAPALVAGLLEREGFGSLRIEPGRQTNEQRLSARDAQGRRVTVEIAAHGSGTGFTALAAGQAEIAAASRPIKAEEAHRLAHLGDLRSREAEQVIAIDGLAVILHPDNPLNSLSVEQLARVFSGEIARWEQLGAPPGAIRLYARDARSGTWDTFNELVLAAHGRSLAAGARRFESSEALSAAVSADPRGIGFIGLPYIRHAKPLALQSGDARPMLPDTSLVASEDYPLARRLYLYLKPEEDNPWARALVRFAQSPRGQALVAREGFVAQTVQAMKVTPHAGMPERYRRLAEEAHRLTVSFRFNAGSAHLDNKALQDVLRVQQYLRAHHKSQGQAVLVGFGDASGSAERTRLLSKLRALAVQRELSRGGILLRDIDGLGEALPLAADSADGGRQRNRRVEVWVY